MNDAGHQNRTENPFSWHILGAGSLGLLWAADLAQQGSHCQLLLTDLQAKTYQGKFHFTELSGETSAYPCSGIAASKLEQSPDQLLVATKACDTVKALEHVRSTINSNCKIILLQNGLGIQQQVRQMFPENNLFCAVVTHGVWRNKDFSAVHAGAGSCVLGCYDISKQKRSELELSELPHTRLTITHTTNIEHSLWQKLLINAVINPLTVKYQCLNGELEKLAAEEIKPLCEENCRIAQACKQMFESESIAQQVYTVIRQTANNRSSMLTDIEQNRLTEINYINGYLLKMASQHNIAAPLNRELVSFVEQANNC